MADRSHRERFWIGADPGGIGNFGLALLGDKGTIKTFCVSSADEAIAGVPSEPLGVGVDAPLWWSSGPSSDRLADRWLRREYRIPAGTVQAANSLRGAALVQGAMFVARLRAQFPRVPVTETHPKALAFARGGWDSAAMIQFMGAESVGGEHERDALCAAIVAKLGFAGQWPRDLAVERSASEQDPKSYWLAPVSYFWFE